MRFGIPVIEINLMTEELLGVIFIIEIDSMMTKITKCNLNSLNRKKFEWIEVISVRIKNPLIHIPLYWHLVL